MATIETSASKSKLMSPDTRVTLTFGQLRELVDDMGNPELQEESIQSAIGISLIAGLLSVGNILGAEEIRRNIPPRATQEQIQAAVNDAGKKTYGGFSAAQATNILVRTIYQEAKGESSLGRKLIATVIWNRAGGKADKLPGVCLKEKQFSVWNSLSGRTPSTFQVKIPSSVATPGPKKDIWDECKELVEQLLDGSFIPEGNYNSYLNPKTASSSAVNGWGAKMKGKKIEGNHTFGYLPENDGFRKGKPKTDTKYATTYTVKAGDNGISYIAKHLIKAGKTPYTSIKDLTAKILSLNSFKKDKHGNPLIRPGDVIKLPS